MRRNKIAIISMKRYAKIGSLCGAPLSTLKYCVVVPPFLTQES